MTDITVAKLRKLKACEDQVAIFAAEWPDGADVTEANVLRATELHLDLNWLASAIFPAPQRKEHKRQNAALWEEFKRQNAPLLEEYERQNAPLWEEYERQNAALWEEYERQSAPLLEEYERQSAPLRKEHKRQNAALFLACWKEMVAK